jgi:hypothetical protein
MWLRVPSSETVVVLDYRGASYLRFSRSGVEVNKSSAMYYLNMTPVAQTPPENLGPRTSPRWNQVSTAHAYSWHDGRLHALASVARPPGASRVGTWKVPILLDGRLSAFSGGLWHADPPSIVWFWPIVVVLLCVLAAWRVRRPALDERIARLLALAALGALAVAAVGRYLHGRPTVSVLQLVVLAVILAFVLWGLVRVFLRRPTFFPYLVIAIVALFESLELIPTLINGFVLTAVPAFVARTASVVGTAAGLALLLMLFRLHAPAEERAAPGSRSPGESEGEAARELA